MPFDFDAGKKERCYADVGIVDEIGGECGAGGSGKEGTSKCLKIFHILKYIRKSIKVNIRRKIFSPSQYKLGLLKVIINRSRLI